MKKILFLLLSCSMLVTAQEINFNQLDNFLENLSENDKFMGSLAISQDHNLTYNKSVGNSYITSTNNQKINSRSKFRIGSITKTFTATMVFQLIEEEKLSLDTNLSEYFPKVPNATKITIDHLLTHSSGVFNLTNAEQFGDWVYKPTNPEEMLNRILLFDADFEPGEKNEYSNTNYLLLGYIVETLDNRTYAESLKERIVDKLGLKNTYYGAKINNANNECNSYIFSSNGWEQMGDTDMSLPGGAGAIVSNANDLIVFMDALFNNKLINEASLKVMTAHNEVGFCRGLFRIVTHEQTVFVHDGGIDGFQSVLAYFPEHNTSVALTSNALNYDKNDIVMRALRTSIGMELEMLVFSQIELSKEEVMQYEGVFKSEQLPFALIFKAEGTTLTGAPEGDNLKTLVAIKKDEFTFDKIGVHLKFDLNSNTLIFTQGDNPSVLFTKKQ